VIESDRLDKKRGRWEKQHEFGKSQLLDPLCSFSHLWQLVYPLITGYKWEKQHEFGDVYQGAINQLLSGMIFQIKPSLTMFWVYPMLMQKPSEITIYIVEIPAVERAPCLVLEK